MERSTPAVRAGAGRPRRGPSAETGSCAVLLELADDPEVRGLLAEHGVDVAQLPVLVAAHRDRLQREPADWYHRLSQRGPGERPTERLLAILRCADSAAHQFLEQIGVSTGQLRKQVFEHLRLRATPTTKAEAEAEAPRTRGRSAGAAPPAGRLPPPHSPTPPRTRPLPAVPPVGSRRESASRASAPGRPGPEGVTAPAPGRREHRTTEAVADPLPLHPVDPAELPPMHGRVRELACLADALLRVGVRPPLLVGERGSGRSLLAAHLASALDRPVFRIGAAELDDEEDLRAAFEAVQVAGGVVVFDDLDRVAQEQPPPFLPELARAWARSSPPSVTVVSHETRAALSTWLPGVLDGLDPLPLAPLDDAEVHAAVRISAPAILQRHGVELGDDTNLADLTRAAQRFLVRPAMPGRALDLLDLACARAVREGRSTLHADTWIRVICERTGLARARVAGSGNHDVLDLEAQLARQVVGHAPVLEALARLVRRNRAGFSSGRPIATALLLGPSGVGKTEIAKALAEALFEREDGLLRLDMSEYAEAHAVARIVGAPPGYVGHEQGGALTDPLLHQPHRVVLLDEIEKAHRDVHQLLLQVLDEGRLTDGRGRTVDFRHSVLIMTSNLGARLIEAEVCGHEGPGRDDADVLAAARAAFPVELWNRIEAPLVLRPLDTADLARICERLARRSSDRLLAERGIAYRLDDTAIARLVALAGADRALGARPLRHLLARRVEAMLAEEILRGRVRAGSQVLVGLRGDAFAILRRS